MDLVKELEKTQMKKVPQIRPGYTIKVHQKIKEGDKERIQVFEGIVIRERGSNGPNATFTVRKITSGVGVERTFPLHSPMIDKIEITGKSKVRRAKLYYLRELANRSTKLQEDKEGFKKIQKEAQIIEDKKVKTAENIKKTINEANSTNIKTQKIQKDKKKEAGKRVNKEVTK